MRLSMGSGAAEVSRQRVPLARPSRNGKRSGSNKRAAQGGHPQAFVLDTAIDGTEHGEQSGPGIVTAVEHLRSVTVRLFRQLPA